jgi:hypothetical protein
VGVESGHVKLVVSDNGIGMTPDVTAHAFELFSQAERSADRSQGGLGIGLALVRSLVTAHGGSVYAWSAGPGLGSTFVVCLPYLEVTHAGLHRAEHPTAGESSRVAGQSALDLLCGSPARLGWRTRPVLNGDGICGQTTLCRAAASRATEAFVIESTKAQRYGHCWGSIPAKLVPTRARVRPWV